MLLLCGAAAFTTFAAAQEAQSGKLNARELFYSAVQAPAAAPQASSPAKAAPKTAAKKASPPAAPETARTETASPAPQRAAAPAVSQAAAPAGSTDGAKVVRASLQPAPVGPPLGLKYTILKLANSNMAETAPDTVFHAGDRIQISVETNGPGYLYVITQGSSGTWRPMFPSLEIADGNNRVEGFRTSVLPPKSRFVFDEQKGVEKLFVVFSREPEPDLEKMIYSLQGSGKTTPAADQAPQSGQQPQKQLVASASAIDDSTVGRLRNTYARDLVIEKVDENTPGNAPGDKKETAVYVVNPSGSSDSRVVADIQLVHQ